MLKKIPIWKQNYSVGTSFLIGLGMIVCFIAFFSIFPGAPRSREQSLVSYTPTTFDEKYPNVYAFASDFRDFMGGKELYGIRKARLERLLNSGPKVSGESLYNEGFRNTNLGLGGKLEPVAKCLNILLTGNIQGASCDQAETFLHQHGYLVDSAIETNHNNSIAYYNRGNDYLDQGNYDQAITDYTKAIQINPTFAEAYYNRSLAHKGKYEFAQSRDDISKARELGFRLEGR